jgi:hypothetical protein
MHAGCSSVQRIGLHNCLQVPIFVVEESNDIQSLMKKSSAFGMGGWWLGGSHMKPNTNFLREVEKKVPKDANVSVPSHRHPERINSLAGVLPHSRVCSRSCPHQSVHCTSQRVARTAVRATANDRPAASTSEVLP